MAALLLACVSAAKTYNTPTIDGRVEQSETDWDGDEWGVDDPVDDGRWYPSDPDLDDLYVTWSADSLFVGIKTQRGPGGFGNGYILFMDTDAQNGITGATDFTNADFYPRKITFSTMGADVIMGGWNLPPQFDIKHCSDPTNTTPVEESTSSANPGLLHVEAGFSWNGLFGLGQGVVPAGTTLRLVAAVVGGDGSGAYDAMPTSTSGAESNPATPWDATTDLDVYYEVVVDGDMNGVPDEGFPPGGSVSGTVTLDDPADTQTVATVTAYLAGVAVASDDAPAGGGDYTILKLLDGDYDIVATAVSYLDSTRYVTILNESEEEGVDFTLQRVNGAIEGEVAITGGDAVDVTVAAYNTMTGALAGDGAQTVSGGAGAYRISTVLDGTYRIEATGKGYVEQMTTGVVADEDTLDAGLMTLPSVVATRYSFVDSTGGTIYSVGTTVSIPDSGIYYYAGAWLEPRDDDGRVAYWDDAAQDGIALSATKLDPAYPPDGTVVFAGADSVEIPDSTITSAMFDDGRAAVLVAGDAIEVLRVLALKGETSGVLEVGVDAPAATVLELTSDVSVIAVGTGVARITGQLKDAAGNDTKVSGVLASMSATGAGGQFSLSTPETDANGRFELDFYGAVAGTTYVTATMDPTSAYANIDVDRLAIVLEPGAAALVELAASPSALRAGETGMLKASVVDDWGNAVAEDGLSVALTAWPTGLLTSLDTPLVTGEDGTASGSLTAGTAYGVVEISGVTGRLPVETVYLPIDATIVAVDEEAPESDDDHNALDGVDLTILRATSDAETLEVSLDFESDWGGIVHLMLAVETRGTTAGGATDPFGFPVSFAHTLLPDFLFTYKYSTDDYADLRRSYGGEWQHYNFVNDEWHVGYQDGVNAVQEGFIERGQGRVTFRLPFSVIETAFGDTVRLQAYVTQEDGDKRTALDSVPHDATHDMIPATGEWWETATAQVTLSNYAEHAILTPGDAPTLSNGAAAPSPARPGDAVTYSVDVSDAGDGIGDVFLDLSSIGGEALVRMMDDGRSPDRAAADGVFAATRTLGTGAADGDHTVTVTARDASNVSESTLGISLVVDNPATALREFDDPVDDDHGPNQTDTGGDPVEGLYYEYPTNFVFAPGSFDITKVEIFADGDWIVFRVNLQDLKNHQDAGAADWGAPQPSEQTCDGPYRTDMNLQKIDIYIDAREGEGATSGFPNRFVDVASVDAWDYGISVEGWGKWFVESNGANSIASWGLFKNDSEINLCNSWFDDYVDIRVDRALFGQDLDEGNTTLLEWDIIVCTGSHDGDSNDQNLGGIRWVNANTSEWQIGGGRDGEASRERDANIMDVAVSPGASHEPGRPQEEMLDYTDPEAMERFSNDKVACVLEASFALDTSPPIVSPFASDPDVRHIPWVALDGAPAVFWTTITDVTGVDEAVFYWHPVGNAAARDSVRMVNLTGDIWAADVSRDDIAPATSVVELVKTGNARVIVGSIRARDASASQNEITTTPKEMGIPEPWASSQRIARIDTLFAEGGDYAAIFQDGTIFVLEPGQAVPEGGLDVVLEPVRESLLDVTNIRDDMTFTGVARDIRLESSARDEVALTVPAWLILHYPQYDVGGMDENAFGIFIWNDETERWIARGGAANRKGNTVAAVGLDELGLFGIFEWDALDVGDERGLSGVLTEPNPFSPNGDGLYDDMIVTFYIGREADYVNIEFYDLAGVLARRLVFQGATNYTGRTFEQITWDGTDMNGNVVPYGLYVMRVEAKFKTEPIFERVNRAIAVIK
ncbi:MAG: glucodextranase DOMON-like domain-containing protein [Candidatus Eisenbacteria bacterium]